MVKFKTCIKNYLWDERGYAEEENRYSKKIENEGTMREWSVGGGGQKLDEIGTHTKILGQFPFLQAPPLYKLANEWLHNSTTFF